MTFTWKFDYSNESMKKKSYKSGEKSLETECVKDRICKVFKFMSFIVCFIGFSVFSYQIFDNFAKGTTLISTSVIKSPNGLLEFPTLLLCNSSAYKEKTLNTTLDGYKSNTMSLKDVVIDAFMVNRDPNAGVLGATLIPIMDKAKEVLTMTHGTCVIFDLKIKVLF